MACRAGFVHGLQVDSMTCGDTGADALYALAAAAQPHTYADAACALLVLSEKRRNGRQTTENFFAKRCGSGSDGRTKSCM
jgi:hypothetical protein